MIKILIADDEKNLRKVLINELSETGLSCTETDSGIKAMDLLKKEEYDVLLLDLNMPGLGGIEVLKKIKSLDIQTEVIILTGHGTVSNAVEAMKLGAYDFLTKPFNLEELKAIIEKAYEKKRILSENLEPPYARYCNAIRAPILVTSINRCLPLSPSKFSSMTFLDFFDILSMCIILSFLPILGFVLTH